MKWISRVEIENFKILKSKSVDFVSGINIIQGPSSRGKTTLMKAIRKCVTNKPAGKHTEFLTWGRPASTPVKIRVFIRDTEAPNMIYTVERVMAPRVNQYNLTTINEETGEREYLEFTNFGTKPPVEIARACGISEVELGKKSYILNIIDQHSSHFMTSWSEEEVAQAVGQLGNSQLVNIIRTGINSDVHSKTISFNQKTEDSKEKQAHMNNLEKELNILREIEEEVSAIEMLLRASADDMRKYVQLTTQSSSIEASLSSNLDILNSLPDTLHAENKCNQAQSLLGLREKLSLSNPEKIIETIVATYGSLEDLPATDTASKNLESAESLFRELPAMTSTLNKLNELSSVRMSVLSTLNSLPETSESLLLLGSADTLLSERKGISDLSSMEASVIQFCKQRHELNIQISKYTGELAELTTELTEVLDSFEECPLCKQTITEEVKEKIRDSH